MRTSHNRFMTYYKGQQIMNEYEKQVQKNKIELELLKTLKQQIEEVQSSDIRFALAIINGNINGREFILGVNEDDTKALEVY